MAFGRFWPGKHFHRKHIRKQGYARLKDPTQSGPFQQEAKGGEALTLKEMLAHEAALAAEATPTSTRRASK